MKRVEAELRKRIEGLEAMNCELAANNARLKRDLQAAARVQQALLPAALPDTAPVRLAWAFRPCDKLAGDLLNIFLLDDRRVGLYLLDVTGHGVAASLLSVAVSHFLTPHGNTSLLKLPAQGGTPTRLARPSEAAQRLLVAFEIKGGHPTSSPSQHALVESRGVSRTIAPGSLSRGEVYSRGRSLRIP